MTPQETRGDVPGAGRALPFHDDDGQGLVRPERRAAVHDVLLDVEVPQGGARAVRQSWRGRVDRDHARVACRKGGAGNQGRGRKQEVEV